jgi:hypothetical protein
VNSTGLITARMVHLAEGLNGFAPISAPLLNVSST